MDDPRWLVDEMLGRLARYLRFLGYDTEYAHGASDDDLVRQAREEQRRLITRDQQLATRTPGAILLTRVDIAGQMSELRAAFPLLRMEVRFDRCSRCNGRLELRPSVPQGALDQALPPEVREGKTALYACSRCGHLYWEGSHTRSVRASLAAWSISRPEHG